MKPIEIHEKGEGTVSVERTQLYHCCPGFPVRVAFTYSDATPRHVEYLTRGEARKLAAALIKVAGLR